MSVDAVTRPLPGWLRQVSSLVTTVAQHPRTAVALRSRGLRMGIGAVAILVAFHYSLLTLVRDLGLDTPLAYLGLVPFISIGIALALPRTGDGPDIQDRELDHIIGLPLVLLCVVAIRVLPHQLSTIYWDDRLDLPVLPVFVFGVSTLLFGLRATWRYKAPIFFLLLAWPLPYTLLIEHAVDASTSLTIKGLTHALKLIPVAAPTPGGDGSLFHIHGVPSGGGSAAAGFDVSIASACAGVNSMVGFVVVGVAFLAVVRRKMPPRSKELPPRAFLRKTAWLGVGLLLVWFLNLARLVLVLAVGKQWGETVALDGLHPYIGIVVFAVAVTVLMLVMPWFGLTTVAGQSPTLAQVAARQERQQRLEALTASGGTPVLWPPSAALAAARPPAGPAEPAWMSLARRMSHPPKLRGGWRAAGVVVVAGALVIGITDASFASFELTAGDLGQPRLTSFDEHPAHFDGQAPSAPASYDWVKRYFGGSATWHRYSYFAVSGGSVTADVIDAGGLSPFNAYNIEACYAFHGFQFTHQKRVGLGGGVDGFVLQFREPGQRVTYDVVYWVWKVQSSKGSRYERVVLLRPTAQGAVATGGAQPQQSPFKGLGYQAGEGEAAPNPSQDVLVRLAKEAVAGQPVAKTTTTRA